MKDFSLYDEKCGTCLTIGYIASAAVAAILVSLVGGSVITQIVLFLFAAAVLGYGANRYCMGQMTAEDQAAPVAPPAKAKPVEKAPEAVKAVAPVAEKATAPVAEKAVAPVAEKPAEPVKKAAPAAKKPAPRADDRAVALAAAKAAAASAAETKAAMAKAVAALESKRRIEALDVHMTKDRSDADKAKIKAACFVIIFAMLGWMGATALGGAMGLPTRFAFLFDLAALAAFTWSLFLLFQVWRNRPGDR